MKTQTTFNKTRMPFCIVFMADRTLFGSIGRIDIDNPTSSPDSLILDETLQLPKSPLMHPFVIFGGFSDEGQVLHYDNTSFFDGINDASADVVVCPSHKACPSSRHLLEKALGRFSPFGLQFTNHLIMFDSFPFNLLAEKHSFGCDSKLVYADINAENISLRTDVHCSIDVFSECKKEKTSSFFVNSQEAFSDAPTEIFFVAVWNTEWNLDTTFDCSEAQDIVLERCTSGEVVSHTYSLYGWLGLSFFDHTTGLLDAGNSELRLQPERTQVLVNEWMEFDIVLDFSFPCFVDAELQTYSIELECMDYLWTRSNLNFSSDICSHKVKGGKLIFKCCGGMSCD